MILGIESSCDESALALFDPDKGFVFEQIHTQIKIHSEYGGVVPDLASREHLVNLPLLLKENLDRTVAKKVSKIAVTSGPGLAGSLALGISAAKAIALKWDLPVFGVNHLRGHAFSPFIELHEKNPEAFKSKLTEQLPHLGLIVSGGNTILFSVSKKLKIEIIAETIDDAAGEALDKGAKLLGFPYPGGPLIEKKAKGGNKKAYEFPRSFLKSKELKFSFSGLKTSLRYRLESMDDSTLNSEFQDICASYQQAVIDALAGKTKQVLNSRDFKSLGLSGGVANNQCLRDVFKDLSEQTGVDLFTAQKKHTGDNAAMIAFAAFLDSEGCQEMTDEFDLSFNPSWSLS